MATIIPSYIDESTPPGEREVFSYLQSAPADWVIFHSLDLTPFNRGKQTEIDFVVVIPDLGILCVEIKSHEFIHFDGSKWSPSTGSSPIKRSPFKQSNDAKFAFIDHLGSRGISYQRIPVYNAVMFPRSSFEMCDGLYFESWNFYDSRRLSRLVREGRFHDELKLGLDRSVRENSDYVRPLAGPISRGTIESLKALCAPIQKFRLTKKEEIRLREQEAFEKLRLQQKSILGQIFDLNPRELLNPRCLIKGAAGTGKTWIALEIAKIMADKGQRVGLFSYNKNVGEWMVRKIAEEPVRPNLVVGGITKVLIEMLGIKVPENVSEDYWRAEFYDEVEELITDPEISTDAMFDYVVIDEAQDFLSNQRLWAVLPQLFKGGLKEGSYCLLGDLDYQLFGSRSQMETAVDVLRREVKVTQLVLRENCRNYQFVAEMALCLSALGDSVYDGYRRSGGGLDDCEIEYYTDQETQAKMLVRTIKKFTEKGYGPEDMIILSFNAEERSSAAMLAATGLKIRPLWKTEAPGIPFATVNSFKGLEAKIVILTDVVVDDSEFRRNQLYTAITRSTESVAILCDESSKRKIMESLK